MYMIASSDDIYYITKTGDYTGWQIYENNNYDFDKRMKDDL